MSQPPRTSPDQVRAVINTSLSDEQLQTWIGFATLVIDIYAARCPAATAKLLCAIETLLAAHLIATGPDQSRYLKSKTIGSSSETYQFAAGGSGYNASAYGQQALMLDPCGILETLNAPSAFTELL